MYCPFTGWAARRSFAVGSTGWVLARESGAYAPSDR
jgi:hypothetical protein